MPTQAELDGVYMGTAALHANLSKGVRAKVGASLVLPSGVVLGGVNGLPKQLGNTLEFEEDGKLVSKQEVIHAELATILKAAREGISVVGGKMYITLSPCKQCASMMISAGITEVIYKDEYRDKSGIELLKQAGIPVRQEKD